MPEIEQGLEDAAGKPVRIRCAGKAGAHKGIRQWALGGCTGWVVPAHKQQLFQPVPLKTCPALCPMLPTLPAASRPT